MYVTIDSEGGGGNMIDIMFVVWRLFCNKMVSVQLFQAYVKKYFKLGNSWVFAKSIHFVLFFFFIYRDILLGL